jgi:hypothetical protein
VAKHKRKLVCNRPVPSTRPGKKFMVRACARGHEKLVHFGAKGYGHNYSAKARRSFRARHFCGTKRASDKLTPRYWACAYLWAGPGHSTAQPPSGARAKR